jgi:hypothetical protein
MIENLKQGWRDSKEGAPGERFQMRYKRRQQSQHHFAQKALFIAGGVLMAG